MHEEDTTAATCWFRSCTFKPCKTDLKPNANQRDHFKGAFPLLKKKRKEEKKKTDLKSCEVE